MTKIVNPDAWYSGELRQPVERPVDDACAECNTKRVQTNIITVTPVALTELMSRLGPLHTSQVVYGVLIQHDEARAVVFRGFLVIDG
ncbi:hypothetical protein BLD48_03870 [Exiguobacterium sp. KRL4]|nr:hypothetical protein BLD48_03870 [Exiguobacterium sp. KRL4]